MTALSLSLVVPWAAGLLLTLLDGRRRVIGWVAVAALAVNLGALVALAAAVLPDDTVVADRFAPDAELVHLHGRHDVIARRQADRPGHFMPPSLLASQFAALEPLDTVEAGVVLDVDGDVTSIVDRYLAHHHFTPQPFQEFRA